MKNTFIYILLIMLSWVQFSCNPELELELKDPVDRIVIDGWIEQNKKPKVLLTSNSPYFSLIDSASLRDLVLTRARVTVSDGENEEVLTLRKDVNYFPPYYYEGTNIYGQTGRTYTVTAEYGGKSAWAETSIPEPVSIDTVFFSLLENEDSIGSITLKFTDPGDIKNYYRIFTKREGIDNKFISTFIMALDDKYFSGKQTVFNLFRAPESYLDTKDNNFFRKGETIIVKLSTMDRDMFEFWSSYQDEILNSTNPFASSLSEVKSNVEGGGLGAWGGYGVSYDTIYTE